MVLESGCGFLFLIRLGGGVAPGSAKVLVATRTNRIIPLDLTAHCTVLHYLPTAHTRYANCSSRKILNLQSRNSHRCGPYLWIVSTATSGSRNWLCRRVTDIESASRQVGRPHVHTSPYSLVHARSNNILTCMIFRNDSYPEQFLPRASKSSCSFPLIDRDLTYLPSRCGVQYPPWCQYLEVGKNWAI